MHVFRQYALLFAAALALSSGMTFAQTTRSVCGTQCPAGYYPMRIDADYSCTAHANTRTTCGALASAPNPLTSCGTSCPANYYPVETGYSPSCGAPFGNAEVKCRKVGGTPITSCGTSCPASYYPARLGANYSCGNAYANTEVTCSAVSGSIITTCGDTCPSNYYPRELSANYSCTGPYANQQTRCYVVTGEFLESCGTTCPNSNYYPDKLEADYQCPNRYANTQVECRRVGADLITPCGTTCPAGYYPARIRNDPYCRDTYSNTETECRKPSGGTIQVCGTACPSGYSPNGTSSDPYCGWAFGNASTSCVDATPPSSARMTSPANNQYVGGIVRLAAEATDNGGLQRVEFWDDSGQLGADSTEPFYIDINTSAGNLDGTTQVRARACDYANSCIYSPWITVNVKNKHYEAYGIWIQPSSTSWGPPNTLTVAGGATGWQYPVYMKWRDVTIGGPWTDVAFHPHPDKNSPEYIWYNTIPSSQYSHVFDIRIQQADGPERYCTYNANGGVSWCN